MTTPSPAPAPLVPTPSEHHDYVVGWIRDHLHLIPNIHDLAADADRARKILPLVEEFIPKLTAAADKDPELAAKLAPLLTEAVEILSVITAL